jgi:small subunit ribosomal protein S8
MTMTDPVANMIAAINNAAQVGIIETYVPLSKEKAAILDVLKKEGYIDGFSTKESELAIQLKYFEGRPAIRELIRVSKSGRRQYSGISELRGFRNGLGIYILSTSKGIMSDLEARKQNVGGEIICKVY